MRTVPFCPSNARQPPTHASSSPHAKQGQQYEDVNISMPLSGATFDAAAKEYDVLVVNFFAPWCAYLQTGSAQNGS